MTVRAVVARTYGGDTSAMSDPTPRIVDRGHVGQIDASLVPRYSGIATFGRLSQIELLPESNAIDIAVVGIPFDSGVTFRPGARFGPAHVREASRLLRQYNPAQQVYPFGELQVVDAGDIAVNPFSISEAVLEIERGHLSYWTGRRDF